MSRHPLKLGFNKDTGKLILTEERVIGYQKLAPCVLEGCDCLGFSKNLRDIVFEEYHVLEGGSTTCFKAYSCWLRYDEPSCTWKSDRITDCFAESALADVEMVCAVDPNDPCVQDADKNCPPRLWMRQQGAPNWVTNEGCNFLPDDQCCVMFRPNITVPGTGACLGSNMELLYRVNLQPYPFEQRSGCQVCGNCMYTFDPAFSPKLYWNHIGCDDAPLNPWDGISDPYIVGYPKSGETDQHWFADGGSFCPTETPEWSASWQAEWYCPGFYTYDYDIAMTIRLDLSGEDDDYSETWFPRVVKSICPQDPTDTTIYIEFEQIEVNVGACVCTIRPTIGAAYPGPAGAASLILPPAPEEVDEWFDQELE